MNKTMTKNMFRTIKKSLGRYIAIMAIIALGSGIFVGLLASKQDIVYTGQMYIEDQNMFDLRLLNSYGWTDSELEQLRSMAEVRDLEAIHSIDLLGAVDAGGKEDVYQMYSMPESINKLRLMEGRMPENPQECVIDAAHGGSRLLGRQFLVSENNDENRLESIRNQSFEIVGTVRSPLYMDYTRGTSSLGDGSIARFLYVPKEAFHQEYYPEVNITVQGDGLAYTDAYDNAIELQQENLKPLVENAAMKRFTSLREEAQKELADGQKEYDEGVQKIEDAENQLEQARQDIEDGKKEIADNQKNLEDGKKKLRDAQKELDAGRKKLDDGISQLEDAKKKTYADLDTQEQQLENQLKDIQNQIPTVKESLEKLDTGITQVKQGIDQLESVIGQMGGVGTESYEAKLQELKVQLQGMLVQKQQAEEGLAALEKGKAELEAGLSIVKEARTQADQAFSEKESQLKSAEEALEDSQIKINKEKQKIADGEIKLEDARKELEEGITEYESKKADADKEIADGKKELQDAEVKLKDARKEIDDLKEPDVYLLSRNTNMGYIGLRNNSEIVAGVSRVFPAFFLLVAALVCITTMTRMVEEERTQIGTMKALGYSSGAIISKYLIYAGSAAVLGCGLGVFAGSIIFPEVIWYAYNIVLSLEPKLKIVFNVPLCLIVVSSYTAVILMVTWYTCRKSLKEVPAELIRPKAPAAGKKIFLEYLPFWKHLSFLNKVTLRNIFRYHQRLLMMLVGIGGCTALLMTGFGIGDSIQDIVSYQFNNVTKYDIQAQFGSSRNEAQMNEFMAAMEDQTENITFAYQASTDILYHDRIKSLYMIAGDENLKKAFSFHAGDTALELPETGEALLSIGFAEQLGIKKGDTVQAISKDHGTMELKISGIFDNNIHNYIIISEDTLHQAWGQEQKPQIAYLTAAQSIDVHSLGAKVSDQKDVSAVMISQDLADNIQSMLGAMDMIVVTVVICAGMLAVIVLYNLTNINITERMREIATIKVLGFRAGETAAYVFKENLLLSVMGCLLGLGGGKLLLDFVMSQIKMDAVWFQSLINPVSVVYSMIITMLMACLVDFILYFRLEKINMAEALKSVE